MAGDGMAQFFEILVAIFLPPLGVFFRFGCCTWEFFICLVLTILGYIPGIIYAVYVIIVKGEHHHADRSIESDGLYSSLPVDQV